jgi:hypothetical protein
MLVLVLLTISTPVSGQALRDQIGNLFIFGSGGDPLFLQGTADPNNPTGVQAHSTHFIPSAVGSNATLIQFLTNALATSVSNIPFSATSSGVTFRFEGGVPVQTSTSPGPIVAERGQTLGRGRVLVGASVTMLDLSTLRGVDLDHLQLNFTHSNADFPGCDEQFGGDCTLQGIPLLENDFIQLDLALDVNVRATTFVMTYGLLDRLDIGVAVPIISTSLAGQSNAQVVPFGGPTAVHFFAGTPESPNLFGSRSVNSSATGIGDISTRLKLGISESNRTRMALLADARFATGSADDLLGAGHLTVSGVGILSSQFGMFGPHANIGYRYRASDEQSDAVIATLGFDQMLSPWATLALDLVSELQAGDSRLEVPEDVTVEFPFRRVIRPSTIPQMRDDIVAASAGMKFVAERGLTVITNAIWPLNKGGLRSRVTWSLGLEYNF